MSEDVGWPYFRTLLRPLGHQWHAVGGFGRPFESQWERWGPSRTAFLNKDESMVRAVRSAGPSVREGRTKGPNQS